MPRIYRKTTGLGAQGDEDHVAGGEGDASGAEMEHGGRLERAGHGDKNEEARKVGREKKSAVPSKVGKRTHAARKGGVKRKRKGLSFAVPKKGDPETDSDEGEETDNDVFKGKKATPNELSPRVTASRTMTFLHSHIDFPHVCHLLRALADETHSVDSSGVITRIGEVFNIYPRIVRYRSKSSKAREVKDNPTWAMTTSTYDHFVKSTESAKSLHIALVFCDFDRIQEPLKTRLLHAYVVIVKKKKTTPEGKAKKTFIIWDPNSFAKYLDDTESRFTSSGMIAADIVMDHFKLSQRELLIKLGGGRIGADVWTAGWGNDSYNANGGKCLDLSMKAIRSVVNGMKASEDWFPATKDTPAKMITSRERRVA